MDSIPAKSAHGQSANAPVARGSEEPLRFAPCQVRKPRAGSLKPGLY